MADMKPTAEGQPRYAHDCEACVYLGQHHECDLYFCRQDTISTPTIIARHSSNGPDYTSGMIFGRLGLHPALTVAYVRAKEMGLIKEHVEADHGFSENYT